VDRRRARRASCPGDQATGRTGAADDAPGARRPLEGVAARCVRRDTQDVRDKPGPRPPSIGHLAADRITAADVGDLVAELHDGGGGLKRESIRKTLSTLGEVLDFAGVVPNPARDKEAKLPREEPEETCPPTADHVEACLRVMPSKYVLPVLWLDWSAHRVTAGGTRSRSVTGTSPEAASERESRRRRQGVVTGVISRPRSPTRSNARCRRATIATCSAALPRRHVHNAADGDRSRLPRYRDAAVESPRPEASAHLAATRAGRSWAEIAELVGNRSAKVLSDTYTHVLMDERELDYETLLDTRAVLPPCYPGARKPRDLQGCRAPHGPRGYRRWKPCKPRPHAGFAAFAASDASWEPALTCAGAVASCHPPAGLPARPGARRPALSRALRARLPSPRV
jgi:hypothetical protein